MVTEDGSGTAAGIKEYVNGSTTPLSPVYTEDNLNASIQNTDPLRIGFATWASNMYFKGEIGFVEVWNDVQNASYSASRWNGGNPVRGLVPEPSALVLLSIGLVSLLAYAWRKRR